MIKCDNFSADELLCPCCTNEYMSDDFMLQLDFARKLADIPFTINSGYRCSNYQQDLKQQGFETAEGLSPHEKGVAADILCSDAQERPVILDALRQAGFHRFGLAHTFIHVDDDNERSVNRIWLYNRR